MTKIKYYYKRYSNYSVIFFPHKGKIFECYVDSEDLERILNYKYKWYVKKYRDENRYYVNATEYLGIKNGKPKSRTVFLHRFISKASDNEFIDHLDHNTFNNRKSNLRFSDNLLNTKHRKGKNSNNTSGYRNVTWMHGWWRVQLQIDGKNHIFKEKFDDVELAGEFAEKARKKYYKEYSGRG